MVVFDIICGLVTLASASFALWTWMSNRYQSENLIASMVAIHRIAAEMVTRDHQGIGSDTESVAQLYGRSIGKLSAIQQITEDYARSGSTKTTEYLTLIEVMRRNLICSKKEIWDIETTRSISEVWFYTPDLKPDSTDVKVGQCVRDNLRAGKKYVYFYPANMPHIDEELSRLLKNIGAESGRLRTRVDLVPLSDPSQLGLQANNVIIYFDRKLPSRCFEDIIFTRVYDRGAWWQELTGQQSEQLCHQLNEERCKATTALISSP